MQKCVSLTEEVDPPPSCSRTATTGGYEKTQFLPSHDSQHVRNPFPEIHPFLRNQKKGYFSLSSPIPHFSPKAEQSIGQKGDPFALFDEDDERPPSGRKPNRPDENRGTPIRRIGKGFPRLLTISAGRGSSFEERMSKPGGRASGAARGSGYSSLSLTDGVLPFLSIPFLSRFRFVPSGRLAPPGIHRTE